MQGIMREVSLRSRDVLDPKLDAAIQLSNEIVNGCGQVRGYNIQAGDFWGIVRQQSVHR